MCHCVVWFNTVLWWFVDTDTSSPAVAPVHRSSDWSALPWHWQWVQQGLQQCRLPLLLHVVPHVQCSHANCTHVYVTNHFITAVKVFCCSVFSFPDSWLFDCLYPAVDKCWQFLFAAEYGMSIRFLGWYRMIQEFICFSKVVSLLLFFWQANSHVSTLSRRENNWLQRTSWQRKYFVKKPRFPFEVPLLLFFVYPR